MFKKILIANRGEIACRIIDTAAHMGVATVAVFSDADAGARHVEMADEAVRLGPAPVAESYLLGEKIIAAAKATGAEAIHPGYGFLSENPEFVQAVEVAGLRFVGPSAAAIKSMGLKDAAKLLMQKAGVPVVPGYHGSNQDNEHLSGAADAIGYPVLIKAVAGGGGKGMRRVDDPKDFLDALASARSEAKTAFGNDDVLIEKYILSPRHIEIQVFGDDFGNAVHLFERDCSLQRRHQKVIEEAPAPDMPPQMRAAMGDAAVKAAKAIGYSGAGTVEFIVDGAGGLRSDGFWFMEMNTRLQVEHPVTEMITGTDLVEWQLRVAAGQPLPKSQEDLAINGWAFEARIYAEDVPKGFLPATGTLTHLQFPKGARADTGVRQGDTISPFYDPMISKLIVHGPTRDIALARMKNALEKTEIAGSVTNIDFLVRLTSHGGFGRGEVDTGLIERDLEELVSQPDTPVAILALAALGAAGFAEKTVQDIGFVLWEPLERSIVLDESEHSHTIVIRARSDADFDVVVQGETVQVRKTQGWRVNGAKLSAKVQCLDGGVSVFANRAYHFKTHDPLDRESGGQGLSNMVIAPMPGLIKAMFVTAGQEVAEGDPLCILEAMKMEHKLLSPRDGTVSEVLASEGSQVESDVPLVTLGEDT